MITVRQLIAGILVTSLCGLLAVQFLRMVEPAAAREIQAACRVMNPAPQNPKLGQLPGALAPEFELKDASGKVHKLSDYRGKTVLVNFWASWCGVCKSEKPSLLAMAEKLAGDDFVVLAIASDTDWAAVNKALPEAPNIHLLMDPPVEGENLGQVALAYGITAVPETFVIDPEGRVKHYFINKRDWTGAAADTCVQAAIN